MRNYSFDLMKVLSVFLIILTHVSAPFVIYFKPESAEFIMGNIFDAISRVGVALFVMITGALWLDENRKFDIKNFFKKYVLKFALLLMVWSSIYGFFYMHLEKVSFWEYVLTFKGTDNPHLWYLYMLLGVYLATPVLRLFVNKKNVSYVLYMIALGLIFQFVPAFLDLFAQKAVITPTNLMNKFYPQFFCGYTVYYLLGWYLANFNTQLCFKKWFYTLALIAQIEMIVLTQMTIHFIPESYWFTYPVLGILTFSIAVALFLLLYRNKNHKSENFLMKNISHNTFGIYIIHILFLEYIAKSLWKYEDFSIQSPTLYMIILTILTFLLSWVSVNILAKIPYLKKIVYK